jgi:cell division protease FtsH
MLLGGRAAERTVFGSITTGASDDLKRVAEIAHSMITEYAMGTGISSQRMSDGNNMSEAMLRQIDHEQQDLADEAFRRALKIVRTHREQLDALAETLLTNEVLERPDIDKVMAGMRVPRRRTGPHGPIDLAAATGSEPPPAPPVD